MDTSVFQINFPCKFHLGDEPDAWQAWFDDTSWEDVTLPHDWSVHKPFSKDYSSGTGYLCGGIGWYRLHLPFKPEWQGKSISINFDGIYKNSRVYFNSYYLGERPNGYVSFSVDVTEFASFERDNILSVYVDRREIADSRWFTGSGILGKVCIEVKEKVHPQKHGIFFTSPVVNNELAIIKIDASYVNETDTDVKADVTYRLKDEDGNTADEINSKLSILSKDEISHTISSTVKKPHAWSADDPYLYTLETYLTVRGNTSLMQKEKVGLRTFKFDPENGFFVNGKPETLKGVCLHHDAGALGGAVPPLVWYDRLLKLKKMGCNAIRMSHNPHVPELYKLCDSLGFYVMDEAFDEWEGPKNKWSTGHNVYPPKHEGYYINFNTWGKKDLTDLILRDRNHPSVILWSIGNEIDYPNDPYCHPSFKEMTGNNDANKPAAERMYNPLRPDASRLKYLSGMLTEVVKETDDTRPVTLAAAFPELSAHLGFLDSVDVAGFNYKEHLYKDYHDKTPDKPLLGSENGHGYKEWKAVTDNDYISGQFLWTGIDYLGEAKGWPVHGSPAGLLTTAGFEKTSFYRRQSFWSDEPMIHLAAISESQAKVSPWGQEFGSEYANEHADVSEAWDYGDGELICVKIYTNEPTVRLYLNDRLIGTYEKENDKDCIIVKLPFEKGVLKGEAVNEAGQVTAVHELKSVTKPCKLAINAVKCDKSKLPLEMPFDDSLTDSFNDLVKADITVTDIDGNRVYTADTLLSVTVKNGKLIAVDNGDLSDVTDYFSDTGKAYKGMLTAYAVPFKKDESMSIEAKGEGLCEEVTV